jgi:hypothetical protein
LETFADAVTFADAGAGVAGGTVGEVAAVAGPVVGGGTPPTSWAVAVAGAWETPTPGIFW